jgi:capsular polysaccharide biosynthesis protein
MTSGSFNPIDFVDYVRQKWFVFAASSALAIALAFSISLLLPRRYTAVASILIQPPAGNDPRAALNVTPGYLESLKHYERIASSDTLFIGALEHLHVREATANTPVESLKKRALKVSKETGTAVLDISATWGNPRTAQALAEYVAQQTVELNKSFEAKSADDLTREFRVQLEAAQARLLKARKARDAFAASQSVETLENDVMEGADLKFRLERDLAGAQSDLAEYNAQQQSPQNAAAGPEDTSFAARQIASTRAKIATLEGQRRDLIARLANEGGELQQHKTLRDAVESEQSSAQAAFENATTRLNDALSASEYRGERLQIIEPGIVPQRPSSPNTLLNVVSALLFALVGSFVYVAFRFSYARLLRERAEREYSLR